MRWPVIKEIVADVVTLWFYFAALGVAHDSAEQVIFSFMAIIYMAIMAFFRVYSLSLSETLVAFGNEFLKLRKLAKDNIEEGEAAQLHRQTEKAIDSQRISSVTSIFFLITYGIVLLSTALILING